MAHWSWTTTLALLASTTVAVPTPGCDIVPAAISASGELECGSDQRYVIETNGGIQRCRTFPNFDWNNTGCIDKPFSIQTNGFDTEIDDNGEYVLVEYYEGLGGEGLPDFPPQFTELWNGLFDACQPADCAEVCVETPKAVRAPLHDPLLVRLTATGEFPSGSQFNEVKGQFFGLLRDAFDRAVVSGTEPGGITERGPTKLRAAPPPGHKMQGYSLRVEMSIVDEGNACGPVAEKINEFGTLVPHLGPVLALQVHLQHMIAPSLGFSLAVSLAFCLLCAARTDIVVVSLEWKSSASTPAGS